MEKAVLVGCLPTYARYYIQARKPHARVRTVTTSSAAAFEHRHILSGSDDAVDYQAAITANRPMPTKVERVKNSIRRATTSKNRESGGSIMAGGIFASTNIFHVSPFPLDIMRINRTCSVLTRRLDCREVSVPSCLIFPLFNVCECE